MARPVELLGLMPRGPLTLHSAQAVAVHVQVQVRLALDASVDATDEVLLRTGELCFGCEVGAVGATLFLYKSSAALAHLTTVERRARAWVRDLGTFNPSYRLGPQALRELVLACAAAWLDRGGS